VLREAARDEWSALVNAVSQECTVRNLQKNTSAWLKKTNKQSENCTIALVVSSIVQLICVDQRYKGTRRQKSPTMIIFNIYFCTENALLFFNTPKFHVVRKFQIFDLFSGTSYSIKNLAIQPSIIQWYLLASVNKPCEVRSSKHRCKNAVKFKHPIEVRYFFLKKTGVIGWTTFGKFVILQKFQCYCKSWRTYGREWETMENATFYNALFLPINQANFLAFDRQANSLLKS